MLEAFRGEVRAFIDREVVPHAEEWTKQRTVARSLHLAAGKAGLFALRQKPYAYTHAMLDEFGRSGHMGCLLSLVLQSEFSTPHLALYGGALKDRFLPRAMAGEWILSIAMTEPEGGSDLAHLKTTATSVADGVHVVGRKWMIGNASLADAVLVVCRSPEHDKGKWPGVSMLLVEKPGFTVVRQLEKTGLHATPNCEIAFDTVVPAENILGRAGLAMPQALVANAYERVALAILAQAAMRAGWEDAVRFLKGRDLLDRSPWRHRLTEDYLKMEGTERIVRDAAASLDTGKPDPGLVLMAKIAATEACVGVLERASQAHGARGFLAEERVGRLYADARALTIGGGATEALVEALSKLVLR